MTKSIADIFISEVVNKLDELFPEPTAKEASNTAGGIWEPCEKEACNTTGGFIQEEVEILNPAAEAQRLLKKAEEVADTLDDQNVKAASFLEIARAHTQVGAQLLDSFDF